MTCCSSEEIIPEDKTANVPLVDAYPLYSQTYHLPRSESEETKVAFEDNKTYK